MCGGMVSICGCSLCAAHVCGVGCGACEISPAGCFNLRESQSQVLAHVTVDKAGRISANPVLIFGLCPAAPWPPRCSEGTGERFTGKPNSGLRPTFLNTLQEKLDCNLSEFVCDWLVDGSGSEFIALR